MKNSSSSSSTSSSVSAGIIDIINIIIIIIVIVIIIIIDADIDEINQSFQLLKRRGFSAEKIQLYYEAYCMFPRFHGLVTAESLYMVFSSIGVNETKSNEMNNVRDDNVCGSISEYNDVIQLFLGNQDEKGQGIDFENFVMGIENFIDRGQEGSCQETVFSMFKGSKIKSERLLYLLEKQEINEESYDIDIDNINHNGAIPEEKSK